MLIVPTRGPIRETSKQAMRTAQTWQRLMPGLTILVPTDINDAVWDRLAKSGQ